MSIWTLSQVLFDLILAAGFMAMWWRLRRPPQDDPRLSRGLQLLQTKITVLEDLSDRTDAQVKQLTSLLDHKARTVQNKILEAEQQMLKIDHSMHKSLEVAEIFQDKIPHQEILERQRTVEYVKAARMANSGMSVDAIAEAVHLPKEQIDLIAKFNRNQLMFDEASLPAWAAREPEPSRDIPSSVGALGQMQFMGQMDPVPTDFTQSDKIARDFKQAVQTAKEQEEAHNHNPILDSRVAETMRSGFESMQPAVMTMKATAQTFKDRLVSTAEDLLKTHIHSSSGHAAVPTSHVQPASHTPPPTAPTVTPASTAPAPPPATNQFKIDSIEMVTPKNLDFTLPAASVVKSSQPIVRKVIFPKIEKAP